MEDILDLYESYNLKNVICVDERPFHLEDVVQPIPIKKGIKKQNYHYKRKIRCIFIVFDLRG